MDLQSQTTVNIQEKSNLIWSIADLIRDYYKPHEYGKVILPMTVIKRFNDTLAPTKQAVLDTYEKVKHFEVKSGFLERASGYKFYNTSVFDFEKLVNDAAHIEDNFRKYLNGFSENVIDILDNFELSELCSRCFLTFRSRRCISPKNLNLKRNRKTCFQWHAFSDCAGV